VADVVKFFRTYYVPNNAVLAVVGDVEPAKVFELARKYLAFIPRKPLPAKTRPAPYVMPAEKRVALTDKVEAEKVLIAWPSPAGQSQGDAEADVLASVLGRGKASRLYQRLVHADQLATSVDASESSMEYGSIFQIEAVAAPGHTTAQLLAAIDDEVKKLSASGPTQAELDSSRARFETDFARRLQNLQARAQMLAGYEVTYGDPNSLQTDLGRYLKATPASLTAAAKGLFVPGRLVVEVKPEAEKSAAAVAAPVGGGK
jgi:zinc protease